MGKLIQPPPSKLATLRLGKAVAQALDPALMQQAEVAAAEHGAQSAQVLIAETVVLAERVGAIPGSSRESPDEAVALAMSVREIEGLAGSYGFGLVAEILGALVSYLRTLPADRTRMSEITALHIDAALNILRRDVKGAGGPSDRRVLDALRAVHAAEKRR